MIHVRPYRPEDLPHLYQISLITGHAGEDASSFHEDPELIGHIYAAPYALLEPELCLVAADGHGVAGFIVGTRDTAAWEHRLEAEWWPTLRQRYPRPNEERRGDWTPDEHRIAMIFNPPRTNPHVIASHPAHLHLNLLPRLQRQRVGAKLLDAWLETASDVRAVHVGVNSTNGKGLAFWRKQHFVDLPSYNSDDRTVWLGRNLP